MKSGFSQASADLKESLSVGHFVSVSDELEAVAE